MRDRVCPIGDCTATVEFEHPVVEVTPRYRLHDLDEVDEFAECPNCEAEVAGFYEEAEDENGVELILDIDEDEAGDGDDTGDAFEADDAVDDAGGSGVAVDGFEDPEDVLEDDDDA